jgi:hypothetical protein
MASNSVQRSFSDARKTGEMDVVGPALASGVGDEDVGGREESIECACGADEVDAGGPPAPAAAEERGRERGDDDDTSFLIPTGGSLAASLATRVRAPGEEGASTTLEAALEAAAAGTPRRAARIESCTFFLMSLRLAISFLRSARAAFETLGAEKMEMVLERARARTAGSGSDKRGRR